MSLIQTSDGAALYCHHWAVVQPKAVMTLVHGFGEHGGRYAHMAAYLNTRGIAVVSADFQGHGQTKGPRGIIGDYDVFRADLAAVLDRTRELYPDVPHLLFGHSMGGGIVLDYGFNPASDIRGIIASAPLIALAEAPSPILKTIVKIIGTCFPKAAMERPIDGTKISTLPEEQKRYEADNYCHGRLGFRLGRAMVEAGKNIAKRAEQWNTPLLLFHSPEDQLTAYEASKDFAARAKQVRFHTMNAAEHEMHNDITRDQVYTLISDFVLEHAKDKST